MAGKPGNGPAIIVAFIVAFDHSFDLIKLLNVCCFVIVDLLLQALKRTGLRQLLKRVHSDHLGAHARNRIGWHHDHCTLIVRHFLYFAAWPGTDALRRSYKFRVSLRSMVLRDRYSQVSFYATTSKRSSVFGERCVSVCAISSLRELFHLCGAFQLTTASCLR